MKYIIFWTFFLGVKCKKYVKVGDIVLVNSTKCSYRARVLEKTDTNFVCVVSIDLGYCDSVHVDYIYELSDDLSKVRF